MGSRPKFKVGQTVTHDSLLNGRVELEITHSYFDDKKMTYFYQFKNTGLDLRESFLKPIKNTNRR